MCGQSDLAYSLVEDKKKLRKTGHNINFETHQNFTRLFSVDLFALCHFNIQIILTVWISFLQKCCDKTSGRQYKKSIYIYSGQIYQDHKSVPLG